MIIDSNYYNNLKINERPKYIRSLFEEGKTVLEMIHGGLPSTSVRRGYKNYSKETGYIEPNRYDAQTKIIDGITYYRSKLPEFENYFVSKDGNNIYSVRNETKLSKFIDKDGYYKIPVRSSIDKHKITIGLHRLILATFKPLPPNYRNLVVDHIDGNVRNNNIDNLRWLTASQNSSKENRHNNAVNLTSNQVIKICEELSKGEKSPAKIAEELGVRTRLVENILYKNSYKDISNNYTFKNYYRPKRIETVTSKEIFESYFTNPAEKSMMKALKMAPQTVQLVKKMIFVWKNKEIGLDCKDNPDLPGYTEWI